MLSHPFALGKIQQQLVPIGVVTWVLEDVNTGKKKYGKSNNLVVNTGRVQMANAIINASPLLPDYIGVGTGTTAPAAGDTDLETVFQYDGANNAKQVAAKFVVSTYKARMSTQFLTSEANTTIREIGLFTAANPTYTMWARVAVNITKTSAHRLTIFWHITFERDTDVALKIGTSIAATGTVTQNTDSTLTFASAVTVLRLVNNTGAVLYVRLNGATTGGNPPTTYDYRMANGTSLELMNEEIEITQVNVLSTVATFSLPDNKLVCVGW
jgi:hypothetical protein